MMDRSNEEDIPPVNVQAPNSARMYDYYLGGAANFAVDRAAADQAPFVGTWARHNRSFLARAVAYLCSRGIDQFLDLGSGVPTVGNVHEIAHRHNPAARVAYVDNEPVAVSHARQLLGENPQVTVTHADIRHPQQVLAAPGVTGLLDFTRPVAVLAVAILHFIADHDQPAHILAGYRRACVPGSYLLISHGSDPDIHAELGAAGYEALHAAYQRTPTPVALRAPEEISALLHDYSLVAPGMVPLDQWRPETDSDITTAPSSAYGLLGYLHG